MDRVTLQKSRIFLLAVLMVFCHCGLCFGVLIREPVWNGKFYPAEPEALAKSIALLTKKAGNTKVRIPEKAELRALILPHAGYQYSGLTAAHASLVLHRRQFYKVVLMGPDHRVGFRGGSVSDAKAWETPLGVIGLHSDCRELKRRSGLFKTVAASERAEHSLEVVLPFLQYYLEDFQLVPIVFGPCDLAGAACEVDSIVDKETLVVVSSDLSHYLPYDEAVRRDRRTISDILKGSQEAIGKNENTACGKIPIQILMQLAEKHRWKPVLLHYANSGDTSGDRSRVVGYAAIAFYGETMKTKSNDYNKEQGMTLVKLARQTLLEAFKRPSKTEENLENALAAPVFDKKRGTFVTLTINGQLRGCIGSLSAEDPLRDGVRKNALNAAFHDPRFPKLTSKELDKVAIEVSILTDPVPLAYSDSRDLMNKLRPNIDGVILGRGMARATFLPQVWQQLPQPESFLSHLCMKAGLASDAWKSQKLDVYVYQVQYFEEHP